MTELIPRTVITEICAHRDAALDKMREALALMEQGLSVAGEAEEFAAKAHAHTAFTGNDRRKTATYGRIFASIDPEASFEVYRANLDARVWMHLVSITGMDKMMDRTARDELYDSLCGKVPEVTEDNIRATLENLALDAKLIFQRGLARAFIDLDDRFRSHDAFKLGSRMILTNVFNGWGMWNYHSRMRQTITDVERVFAVLDGKEPDGSGLIDAISESRGGGLGRRQGYVETAYFRIRSFKNGNAHLWFTRDDLVEKANLLLAEYYGEVLPDAYSEDVTVEDVRTTALSKDLAFYATPAPLIEKVLRDSRVYINEDSRVLEPSAGEGAIARALLERGATVEAIEVDPGRVAALSSINHPRLTVQAANFLTMRATPRFTHVVMNPPFCGTHWMGHVRHAFDFLEPGGTLVAILPATAMIRDTKKHKAFRKWAEGLSSWGSPWTHLPPESFAESGTRVNTCTLTIHKTKK